MVAGQPVVGAESVAVGAYGRRKLDQLTVRTPVGSDAATARNPTAGARSTPPFSYSAVGVGG